jgi:peptidoglycan/xylan/chitin deacetylase (PgdA/CDA1 family)
MELAFFSFYSRLRERSAGGAGVILRFERVRPRNGRPFEPNRWREITPQFLDRTIRALRDWNFDLVTMDEACRRAVTLPNARRFACLTFDGAGKDIVTQAWPVLSKHGVPFTVYVPTAFPDGIGDAWWLALEQIISREQRIHLMIDRRECRFATGSTPEKYVTFDFLQNWLRNLPPPDLALAIRDLCKRCSVDLEALSRDASMDWDDLAKLAADPLVTIGSATVNHHALSNLKDAEARREMAMGKAVAEAALRRPIHHFAYPFGDAKSWRRAHMVMAQEAGYASAVSTVPGVVQASGASNLHALPRVAWDGRLGSLRLMRVMLSGVMFSKVRQSRDQPE